MIREFRGPALPIELGLELREYLLKACSTYIVIRNSKHHFFSQRRLFQTRSTVVPNNLVLVRDNSLVQMGIAGRLFFNFLISKIFHEFVYQKRIKMHLSKKKVKGT